MAFTTSLRHNISKYANMYITAGVTGIIYNIYPLLVEYIAYCITIWDFNKIQ